MYLFIYLSKFSSNEGKAARRNQQAVQLTIERLFFLQKERRFKKTKAET